LAFCGFFGGKGSDGLWDWVVVLVGCAVFGEQCACGATRGRRETGSPAATTCFFCFAIRVVLAPLALHTACGCLFVMGRQCACGATRGWWETGSPAATTCFFVLPFGWVWRMRRYIVLEAGWLSLMWKQCAFGATYCFVGISLYQNSSPWCYDTDFCVTNNYITSPDTINKVEGKVM